MRRFASLRSQADFARLRRHGRRVSTKSFVIYRSEALPGDARALVGITVSKAIGKAVLRNKLRRRLAAVLDEALAPRNAMRLLFVARPFAANASFGDLRAEVTSALGPV
ncbi:MAG: ribonuclease P protein component [Candidatus Eremiobacteraeota bacterium]|nr:ribonuclease P protein component [Candidatus Eremiobacteraeota bacterium]MBV8497882.1 ribonuclease P protein component [Candidatus Eremiobacteraeota bacterium]